MRTELRQSKACPHLEDLVNRPMSIQHSERSILDLCPLSAAAVPILYFGTQFVAAPFYSGYSFSRHIASMLGTRGSQYPWIFNGGMIIVGFAAFLGAIGLYRSFRPLTHPLVSWLIGFSVVFTGFMSIKAGLFPLPDPRHASWGTFQVYDMIFTVLLMLIGLWRQGNGIWLRTYLLLSLTFALLTIPLIFQWTSVPLLKFGAIQRIAALSAMVPIGVVGYYFWRETRRGKSVVQGAT